MTAGRTLASAPVRWGILGAANIAIHKVVPAMLASKRSKVVAIASRNAGESARRGAGPVDSARIRLVRGADRRSRDRGDLQSAAESPARPLVDPRGGSRQARALREADRPDGR